MRISLLLFCLLIGSNLATAKPGTPTLIVVDKSDRLLHVFVNSTEVATFSVGLGTQPIGPKRQEGDKRTPEGEYVLDYRKADSAYFKAIHISYPSATDRANATRLGVRPGGAIMIHGQPNDPLVREAVRLYPFPDWTDGCIALSNADMQTLWDMVKVPTAIRIIP